MSDAQITAGAIQTLYSFQNTTFGSREDVLSAKKVVLMAFNGAGIDLNSPKGLAEQQVLEDLNDAEQRHYNHLTHHPSVV